MNTYCTPFGYFLNIIWAIQYTLQSRFLHWCIIVVLTIIELLLPIPHISLVSIQYYQLQVPSKNVMLISILLICYMKGAPTVSMKLLTNIDVKNCQDTKNRMRLKITCIIRISFLIELSIFSQALYMFQFCFIITRKILSINTEMRNTEKCWNIAHIMIHIITVNYLFMESVRPYLKRMA